MDQQEHNSEHKVAIQVATGSGNYPENGFRDYNTHEKLSTVLHQTQIHLHLQDTNGWVARAGERILNPDLTLGDNGLIGRVRIVWAPTERGGGACIPR